MIMSKQIFIGGTEVKPGASIRHHTNHDKLSFEIFAVCDSVEPLLWHGEVRYAGNVLIRTAPTDDDGKAGRFAESLLTKRVIALFADPSVG